MQAVNERSPRARAEDSLEKESQKKLKKLLKNLLTNARECDIILGHFSAGLKRAVLRVEKKF